MQILFSVIIPTYNGQQTIGPLINKIDQSPFSKNIEIIIIDSSSTDKTVNIVQNYSKKSGCSIKIIFIKKETFNHGLTRNLGVKTAKGKYIYFLSQDVLPINDIFKPVLDDFNKYKNAVVVFGKQISYQNTDFLQKLESKRHFSYLDSFTGKTGILLQNLKKPFIKFNSDSFFIWIFLSDVCACYKRSFLVKHPFEKIKNGEDVIQGKYIITNNLTKIYDKRVRVFHSHDYNLYNYYEREKQEFWLVAKALGLKKKINVFYKIRAVFKTQTNLFRKVCLLSQLVIYYFIKLLVFLRMNFVNKYD